MKPLTTILHVTCTYCGMDLHTHRRFAKEILGFRSSFGQNNSTLLPKGAPNAVSLPRIVPPQMGEMKNNPSGELIEVTVY